MESTKPLTTRSRSTNRKKTLVVVSSEMKGVGQSDADPYSRIAVSAYYKAQARGFQSGHELDDWLTAEAEERQ